MKVQISEIEDVYILDIEDIKTATIVDSDDNTIAHITGNGSKRYHICVNTD